MPGKVKLLALTYITVSAIIATIGCKPKEGLKVIKPIVAVPAQAEAKELALSYGAIPVLNFPASKETLLRIFSVCPQSGPDYDCLMSFTTDTSHPLMGLGKGTWKVGILNCKLHESIEETLSACSDEQRNFHLTHENSPREQIFSDILYLYDDIHLTAFALDEFYFAKLNNCQASKQEEQKLLSSINQNHTAYFSNTSQNRKEFFADLFQKFTKISELNSVPPLSTASLALLGKEADTAKTTRTVTVYRNVGNRKDFYSRLTHGHSRGHALFAIDGIDIEIYNPSTGEIEKRPFAFSWPSGDMFDPGLERLKTLGGKYKVSFEIPENAISEFLFKYRISPYGYKPNSPYIKLTDARDAITDAMTKLLNKSAISAAHELLEFKEKIKSVLKERGKALEKNTIPLPFTLDGIERLDDGLEELLQKYDKVQKQIIALKVESESLPAFNERQWSSYLEDMRKNGGFGQDLSMHTFIAKHTGNAFTLESLSAEEALGRMDAAWRDTPAYAILQGPIEGEEYNSLLKSLAISPSTEAFPPKRSQIVLEKASTAIDQPIIQSLRREMSMLWEEKKSTFFKTHILPNKLTEDIKLKLLMLQTNMLTNIESEFKSLSKGTTPSQFMEHIQTYVSRVQIEAINEGLEVKRFPLAFSILVAELFKESQDLSLGKARLLAEQMVKKKFLDTFNTAITYADLHANSAFYGKGYELCGHNCANATRNMLPLPAEMEPHRAHLGDLPFRYHGKTIVTPKMLIEDIRQLTSNPSRVRVRLADTDENQVDEDPNVMSCPAAWDSYINLHQNLNFQRQHLESYAHWLMDLVSARLEPQDI